MSGKGPEYTGSGVAIDQFGHRVRFKNHPRKAIMEWAGAKRAYRVDVTLPFAPTALGYIVAGPKGAKRKVNCWFIVAFDSDKMGPAWSLMGPPGPPFGELE